MEFKEPVYENHFPKEVPLYWISGLSGYEGRDRNGHSKDYNLPEWKERFFNEVKTAIKLPTSTPIDTKKRLEETLSNLEIYFDLTCDPIAFFYIKEYKKKLDKLYVQQKANELDFTIPEDFEDTLSIVKSILEAQQQKNLQPYELEILQDALRKRM